MRALILRQAALIALIATILAISAAASAEINWGTFPGCCATFGSNQCTMGVSNCPDTTNTTTCTLGLKREVYFLPNVVKTWIGAPSSWEQFGIGDMATCGRQTGCRLIFVPGEGNKCLPDPLTWTDLTTEKTEYHLRIDCFLPNA